MQNMKIVIDRVRAEGYSVKIMVGGAPVTAAFAQQIGADGYARNAVEAVEKAKAILGLAH
jgi:5-methyltetrahydrofolate--homocysteine methyltransferase